MQSLKPKLCNISVKAVNRLLSIAVREFAGNLLVKLSSNAIYPNIPDGKIFSIIILSSRGVANAYNLHDLVTMTSICRTKLAARVLFVRVLVSMS